MLLRRNFRRAASAVLMALLLQVWPAQQLAAAAPGARATDSTALATLARRLVGADQGLYVEASDGTVLVQQAAARPVHPASVSKIPTTLALLHKLGSDYRFATEFRSAAPLRAGVLEGDLYVASNGDPYLVDENALLIAKSLRELGISRVDGQLRILGPLMFDWSTDKAGRRLQQALSGLVPPAAWDAVRGLSSATIVGSTPSGTATASSAATVPAVQFSPAELSGPGTIDRVDIAHMRVLLTHRSQPLVAMVKQLNDYSNNVFKPLADAAGGAAAVQAYARSVLPATMHTEVTLGDGAGTDSRNRLSPRAAVKLLRELERELQSHGSSLPDALPVSGEDAGTLKRRMNGLGQRGHLVGKTGTFGDYGASALTGAFKTERYGTVYFAILNHGIDVPEARRRQDKFTAAMLAALNSQSWGYVRDARPAVAAAEVVSSGQAER
jgi:serine-type D-Ala-D-Ala carboxypeptidase/endopeptidase (penicillin-binding protein 4)